MINFIDLIEENKGSFTLEYIAENIDKPAYVYIVRVDDSDGMGSGLVLIKNDDDLEKIIELNERDFSYISATYHDKYIQFYMSNGSNNFELTCKFYNLNKKQKQLIKKINKKYKVEVYD
jgi:hypothetical protein